MKIQSVPRSKHFVSVIKVSQLMLYREIIAVCSEIHTKHINTLCGQNVELLNVKLVVHMVTTGPYWVTRLSVCNEKTLYCNCNQKPFVSFRFSSYLQPFATAGVVYRNLLG